MPAELHLHREQDEEVSGFSMEEWVAAVATTPGVRIIEGDATVPLPDGRRVKVGVSPGDAEVLIEGEWTASFWCRSDGTVTFNAVPGIESDDHATHRVASELTRKLGAVIRDDDWELHEW